MQTNLPTPATSPLALPIMLRDALRAFQATRPGHTGLDHFEAFLGAPAPLLAFTPLTGEAWMRSLESAEREASRAELSAFRAFLRDHGWLDAALPVNVPD